MSCNKSLLKSIDFVMMFRSKVINKNWCTNNCSKENDISTNQEKDLFPVSVNIFRDKVS